MPRLAAAVLMAAFATSLPSFALAGEITDDPAANAQDATPLMDAIKAFLNSKELVFRPHPRASSVVIMDMNVDGRRWSVFLQAREPQHQVVIYSVHPYNAPANSRTATMEFLTRANYGLILGNFEFDLSDGEVRYKTSIDVEGAQLNNALLTHMLDANLHTFWRYFHGAEAVMKGEKRAAQAIAEIEG